MRDGVAIFRSLHALKVKRMALEDTLENKALHRGTTNESVQSEARVNRVDHSDLPPGVSVAPMSLRSASIDELTLDLSGGCVSKFA